MTKDEVIKLAQEAGGHLRQNDGWARIVECTDSDLERFAHLCRADMVSENERLKQEYADSMKHQNCQYNRRVAERDALKDDAERYRWLRDNDLFANPSVDLAHVFSRYADSYLDGHIDALMKRGEE